MPEGNENLDFTFQYFYVIFIFSLPSEVSDNFLINHLGHKEGCFQPWQLGSDTILKS